MNRYYITLFNELIEVAIDSGKPQSPVFMLGTG
jgi:hypothetical protein